MGARRGVFCGVVAAVLLAGCGGSGHKAPTVTPPAPSTSQRVASPPSGIRGQVLTNDELAGFTEADRNVYTTPSGWVSPEQATPPQLAAEKAMLRRDGFRIGVHEDLLQGSMPGLSTVQQFRSAGAARNAMAFYLAQTKASGATTGAFASFRVPGIPGAVGFSLGGSAGGSNIAFSDGADYYLVGRQGASAQNIAGLIAAAQHLYRRVPR